MPPPPPQPTVADELREEIKNERRALVTVEHDIRLKNAHYMTTVVSECEWRDMLRRIRELEIWVTWDEFRRRELDGEVEAGEDGILELIGEKVQEGLGVCGEMGETEVGENGEGDPPEDGRGEGKE